MIIVTGGAGFIGSNIIRKLNALGRTDILLVDDLTDGVKFRNIADCQILDYLDKDLFLSTIIENENLFQHIEAIFHQGACVDTTEWNGKFMLQNNYEYSKLVLHYCLKAEIPFIYASSAAVYGANKSFAERPVNEAPLNMYAYSKLLFDQYVRRILPKAQSQIVGLRYFNVYGPYEWYKGAMASIAFQLYKQFHAEGVLHLFEGSDNYAAGEQLRDFIYVDDVAAVNLWFWQHPKITGIYNVGTGESASFNSIAQQIINCYGRGSIEYIPFPTKLRGCYQSFTQANISQLRQVGYNQAFKSITEGMQLYLQWLNMQTIN